MTERYTPVVGDMVRQSSWGDAYAMEVTAVGRTKFLTLTIDRSGVERQWSLKDDWIQVVQPEPLTETWVCVSTQGVESRHADRSANDAATAVEKCQWVWGSQPVAVIHIWTDADGDHAEIERVAT